MPSQFTIIGFAFAAAKALQSFVDHTNASVTGVANVRLFKGRAMQIGAKSPHTLYDPQLASFSMEVASRDVNAARRIY